MRLNWLAYNYKTFDGYGRYSAYMIRALRRAGVTVGANFIGASFAPRWLRDEWDIDNAAPTIVCAPPYFLQRVPKDSAPHWLLSMTEGSELPDGWAETINKSDVSRVIVPCEHNAEVFRSGGVEAPISVIAGGTDPDEFPYLDTVRPDRPYTFLSLGDRGGRKGYSEVHEAFYKAFGGKTTGTMDVRLMMRARPTGNVLVNKYVKQAVGLDRRLLFSDDDIENMADLYSQVDCFAIPSHSEGWGMPHREAAMMGLPVITQRYSGMDDGHTHEWALVIENGVMQPVQATKDKHIKGMARRADVGELAAKMRWCYDNRAEAAAFGRKAALWLRQWQTWDHSANALIALLQREGVLEREYA